MRPDRAAAVRPDARPAVRRFLDASLADAGRQAPAAPRQAVEAQMDVVAPALGPALTEPVGGRPGRLWRPEAQAPLAALAAAQLAVADLQEAARVDRTEFDPAWEWAAPAAQVCSAPAADWAAPALAG
ncbi:MAG TPA: hypothetical protein VFA28_08895 [Bryobacteraceae bacterium]|nr:hypothetical protein [Bryobacteraceae bacterium]